METFIYLSFNLSILILLQFVFQTLHLRKLSEPSPLAVTLYFSLGVLCSLLLSVSVNEDIRLDLRQIPLIVGTLYLGKRYGFYLLVVLMVIRGLYGVNEGFWISLMVYGVQVIGVSLVQQWYIQQNTKKKLAVAILTSLLSSIAFMISLEMFGHSLSIMEWAVYFMASILGAGFLTMMVEHDLKVALYSEKVTNAEKETTVSRMSASISHEVRNPLTTVKGFLQLLREQDFPAEKREEFIKVALSELERAENLITDYLGFSKPSERKTEILSLHSEISRIIAIIQPMAAMNSVEVEAKMEEGGRIVGDRNRLHQSLINLFKNAIEAMPAGGKLIILLYTLQNQLFLHIEDNGVGMTKAQLDKIGEPFHTTKGEKGTGLGTAVAFSFIKEMGGILTVKSKPGNGTSIVIAFPAAS